MGPEDNSSGLWATYGMAERNQQQECAASPKSFAEKMRKMALQLEADR